MMDVTQIDGRRKEVCDKYPDKHWRNIMARNLNVTWTSGRKGRRDGRKESKKEKVETQK